ncbi:MAG: hydrogenase iron-sulfur subunit [Acetivibrionales bacterium]|jgi:coenzyme F420-reducing hydrogenase delta subunit/Pyruvate/2-oxoacid:ferredoxin oxidoreductase delta subunit
MDIAVLGKSHINNLIKEQFEPAGFKIYMLDEPDEIKSIKGEPGAFTISGKGGSLEVAHIIVTEEPCYALGDKELPGGNPVVLEEIDSPENAKRLESLPIKEPVVFILDYPVESTAYMTRLALEKAIGLLEKKRKVVYLAKYMRTAGAGLEGIFRKARNLGAVFFKYDAIAISYSGDNDVFSIEAYDAAGGFKIVTGAPVISGEALYGSSFLSIIKLLRLKMHDSGRFFLFPSYTGRKGVYFANAGNTSGSNDEVLLGLKSILFDITRTTGSKSGPRERPGAGAAGMEGPAARNDLAEIPDDGRYPVIDPGKCAFCYTCFRACTHFAMSPDYDNSVMKNIHASCFGCGVCASVCPAGAISMSGNTKAADNGAAKGCLKVFCCENSAAIAFKRIGEASTGVEITTVSCGGELGAEVFISALKDFERVLVAVCMDDACRHFDGNLRVKRYVDRAKEMLKASGMDENRVACIQLSHAMPTVLDEYIKEMASK